MDFEADKRRVVADGVPSSGDNLHGMELDLGYNLTASESVDQQSVRVERTGDRHSLLDVRCHPVEGVDVETVGAEVASLWRSRLRYDNYESHRLISSGEAAVLEFVTQMEPHGLYVTGRVAVETRP